MNAVRRGAWFGTRALGDLARRGNGPGVAAHDVEAAYAAAVGWLCRTHDATGRQGSSKAFTLRHGWLPGYPETTGYVLGTLLEAGERLDDATLAVRAREMGDWEIAVQNADGGVMEGAFTSPPRPSVVFNTGMVIHGWLDLHESTGEAAYLAAAERAGAFLTELRPDGTWPPEREYGAMPHTYNSRVDWALIRLAATTGHDAYRAAAVRNLDWVVSVQRPNGWFDWCYFKPGMLPSTHGLAYTARGLLESAALLDDSTYLDAALVTARALADVFESRGHLPATYDEQWTPRSRYWCLTGTAQVGGVWLRLAQLTGDRGLWRLGEQAVRQAAAKQVRSSSRDLDGALPGSFPVFGRYAPFQFPNWPAKFLADALHLSMTGRAEPVPAAGAR